VADERDGASERRKSGERLRDGENWGKARERKRGISILGGKGDERDRDRR